MSEITYPCFIRNVFKGILRAFKNTRLKKLDRKSGMNECNKVKNGIFLKNGIPNLQELLDQLALFSSLDFESYMNEGDQLVRFNFKRPADGITLEDDENPRLLGLQSDKDYYSGRRALDIRIKKETLFLLPIQLT